MAIESVLNQKTSYKYKIHIFDDASSDKSAEIAQKYVDKYPDKIFLFSSKENKGAQENIWNAYKSVDTEYCCLLETDDYWCDKNKLDLQIKALENNPDCSFCSHKTKTINLNDKYRRHEDGIIDICNEKVLNSEKISIHDIKAEAVGTGYITSQSSRLIRFSLVNLPEIQHKEAFLWDNCQFFYLLLKGNMYFVNRIMSVYCMTGNGVYSGKNPLIRVEKFIDAHIQFNKETNYIMGDRIIHEIVHHINYYLWLLDINRNTAIEDGIVKDNLNDNIIVNEINTSRTGIKQFFQNLRRKVIRQVFGRQIIDNILSINSIIIQQQQQTESIIGTVRDQHKALADGIIGIVREQHKALVEGLIETVKDQHEDLAEDINECYLTIREQQQVLEEGVSRTVIEQHKTLRESMIDTVRGQHESLTEGLIGTVREQHEALTEGLIGTVRGQHEALTEGLIGTVREQHKALGEGLSEGNQEIKNQQQKLAETLDGNYLEHNFELIQKTIKLQAAHQKTFGLYKNSFSGKSVVLIATGPSLNYFDNKIIEKNAIYIGVNSAYMFEKVTLDYLFMHDYLGVKHHMNNSLNYKNKGLKRFYGSLDPDIENGELTIPENTIIAHGASKYYMHHVWYRQQVKSGWTFAIDLSSEVLYNYGSVSFDAMQFILYGNPKKIYIVGCDVSNIGKHAVGQDNVLKDEQGALYANQFGWKKLKEFINVYYPLIEVISINPVGLKGLFNDDVYTESFLKDYPENR